jgi:hypothetical protein
MKHRTALVTAMSVMVVVLAATAAIAANLGILSNGTDTGRVGGLTVATVPTAADPVRKAPASQITKVEDTATQTTTSTIPEPPAAPAGDITAYSVGDAGVVTLRNDGSRLSIVTVEPAAGWQSAQIPSEAAIEVGFVGSDGTVLMFAAQLDATGTIQTVVEDLTATPAGSGTSRSDNDDDEGHEDDDD